MRGGTNTDNNSRATQITNNGLGITSFTKLDAGTWILTNPNSSYTGITTISGGVLGVDKLANGGLASSLGASTAAASNLVIGNGSTLRYTGTGDTRSEEHPSEIQSLMRITYAVFCLKKKKKLR